MTAKMPQYVHKEIAKILDNAAVTATAVPQSTVDMSIKDAYAIQRHLIGCRLARGQKGVGVKVGFTSRAKRVQMGVHDLIWGQLTDDMMLAEGGDMQCKNFIHPRAEPEIAFLTNAPLSGEISLVQAIGAVGAVAPAMEIIDSRYENFKFSLNSVVADNCSSSGFVIGAWQAVPCDISNLGMVLEFNGRAVEIGSSAAIMGNPYRSLVEVVRLMGAEGMELAAGSVVLAGAATAAQAIPPHTHIRVRVQDLGTAEITAT